ncbi:unnamed protein product [Durusdinium trenchii]|uniref:Uncharacterized protein n=2 Tax=Durusdinium trenchii TaxID=1381693 RepID=A0ABP0M8W4_9DINO
MADAEEPETGSRPSRSRSRKGSMGSMKLEGKTGASRSSGKITEELEEGGGETGDPELSAAASSALSKMTGQVKALKFAMDLAKKAYDARDDLLLGPERPEPEEEEKNQEENQGERKPRRTVYEKEEEELMELFTKLEPPIYKPAPLHVRGLCQAAKRQCNRQKLLEEERLQVLEQLRRDERPSNLKCLSDEELNDIELTGRRVQYHVALLQRRQERLAKIDNKTFQQLPGQLIEAGADGDYDFIKLCVEASVPLDMFNERGVTALITATVNNKVSSAKLLLDSAADPSMQDLNGANCVHYAVGLRRLQILDLALGAINRSRCYVALYVKDARGKNVLDYARSDGHEESLRLLKLRLGGPIGFVWAVTDSMVYNAVAKLPSGDKGHKGMARAVARLAAERAAQKIQEKIRQAKEKARERLLGGWLCSYCSKAISHSSKWRSCHCACHASFFLV